MKLNRFQDASQFYERTKDYLLSHEAQQNLLLGLSRTLIRNPEQYNCQPYLATVEVDGTIVAVAMRTPPRNLLLSRVENFAAVEVIARDLYAPQEQLSGVESLVEVAKAFTQKWQFLTGQPYQLSSRLRIY